MRGLTPTYNLDSRRRLGAPFNERPGIRGLHNRPTSKAKGHCEAEVSEVQFASTLVYTGASIIFAGAAFLSGAYSLAIGIGTMMGGVIGLSVLLARRGAWGVRA